MQSSFHKRNRGFTLIEIMVALVIFAIMMTALFASFRTGMQAYSMGTEHAEQQQLGRYAVNQLVQDLRNIYYKPESEYNVARRQQEALIDANDMDLQSASGRDVIDENLPELGPPIDLSFTGEDGGDTDQLSLVRQMGFSTKKTRALWSLGRVTYYVQDGNLYRAVDDITTPETDEDGNVVPKANPPKVDKLAENCITLDFKYGYYFDEDWYLADSWDSNASQYRNPPEEDEDDDIVGTMGENASEDVVQSGGASAALASMVDQQQQQQRADDLPGWIELTLQFATEDEDGDIGSARTYTQTILMYNKYAVETYLPEDEEDILEGARGRRDREQERDRSGSEADGPAGGRR